MDGQVTIGRDPASGKLKRATLYGKTRQEVADKLTKALMEKQHGTLVAPHKLTLGAWLDTWLREYKKPQLGPLSLRNYESVIRLHLKPALGHLVLQEVRPEHVQQYYNAQTQHGLDATTISLHRRTLSQALTLAEQHQLVARNVARLATAPRQRRKERQTLTVEEVTTKVLPALQGSRLSAAFLLLFMTGLRRAEVAGLRWQDIDWLKETMHIRQTRVRVPGAERGRTVLVVQEPKTASSRRSIPLPGWCVAALKQHRARQAEEKLALGPGYRDQGSFFAALTGSRLILGP